MGNGMNKILPGLFLGNFIGKSKLLKTVLACIFFLTDNVCHLDHSLLTCASFHFEKLEGMTFEDSAFCLGLVPFALRTEEKDPDAKDFDQLSRHNITHIISIHESPQPYIPGITYLRIVLPDTPEANIKKHFKKCIHFIHSCRLHGGCCLVHCLAGISRSTTIVLAYIMTVTQASWREALEAVKVVRPVANPNPGFRQQLEEYEGSRSEQKIRRRLERKYGINVFNDEEEIRALLTTGKRRDPFKEDEAPPVLVPKSRGTKRTDPFLLRVKETFSCLPGCLK